MLKYQRSNDLHSQISNLRSEFEIANLKSEIFLTPLGSTYYLSCSSRSMRKTSNYRFATGISTFLLSLWLIVLGSYGVAAQEKAGGSGSPTATPLVRQASEGAASSAQIRSKASKTIVDGSIPADPALDELVKPYSARVRELEVVIGNLDGELKKGGLGAGSLGNFVTDGMLAEANSKLGQPVDVAITNSGGLRKNAFSPGQLRVLDIFELLPFENKLMTLELTGDQLLKALQIVAGGREAQSGARIRYRVNAEKKTELVSATLVGGDGKERPIDAAATYRVVTIDYLLNVGGNLAILAQGKNIKPLGITIRDAMIEYVKAETAAGRVIKSKLDGRFTSR